MVITMAKRMAHASTHGARKMPGPIQKQCREKRDRRKREESEYVLTIASYALILMASLVTKTVQVKLLSTLLGQNIVFHQNSGSRYTGCVIKVMSDLPSSLANGACTSQHQ